MQTRTTLWLLFVIPSLALAGCSQDPAGSDGTGDDVPTNFEDFELQASETTGILRGVVIDEAIRPLGGVLVVVMKPGGGNLTMETEDDGLFGFDGLEAGTYFLTASKATYVGTQVSAEVVAGEDSPDAIKVLLAADPAFAPYVQPYHMDGYMECSRRPMFFAQQCDLPGGQTQEVNEDYDLGTVAPQFIQSEMTWDSTQAVGDELSLAIRCLPGDVTDPAGKCPDGTQGIVRAEGVSPLVAPINRTLIEQWALGGPGGNPLSINLFVFGRSDLDVWDEETIDNAQKPVTGKPCMEWGLVGQVAFGFGPGTCMRATGPGLVLNQKIDVYTHVFYGYEPPAGWSFVAGDTPPSPP